MEEMIMFRPIRLALTLIAAVALSTVCVDEAHAFLRRSGGSWGSSGSSGSYGSCGSFGGGDSFGGLFSRRGNDCCQDYGSEGGHGSCGSHGGTYYRSDDQNGEEHRAGYGPREYGSDRDVGPGEAPPAPRMEERDRN